MVAGPVSQCPTAPQVLSRLLRITVEEQPESIKRYSHIKRIRGVGVKRCGARLDRTRTVCTRELGHNGPHVAHGLLSRVIAVWDETPIPESRHPQTQIIRSASIDQAKADDRPMRQKRRMRHRSHELPTLTGRALQNLWQFLKSPDEVGMVFLFFVFLYWGIQWMIMILQ